MIGIHVISSQEISDNYIETYQLISIQEMERTGIPASIKLAQGLLESNIGRSELAQFAHNHFGIKCGSSWEGNTYYKVDDDLDERGQLKESCFRVFESDESSFIAHSEFLMRNKRYGFLFDYSSTDYKSWAKGLRKAGYATDPKYPSKIIGVIQKYDLSRFDYMASDELNLLAQHVEPSELDLTAEEAFIAESTNLHSEEIDQPNTKRNLKSSKTTRRKKLARKNNSGDFTRNFVKYEKVWNRVSKDIDRTANEAKRKFNRSKEEGGFLKKWMDEIVSIGEKELAKEENKRKDKSSNSKKEFSFER